MFNSFFLVNFEIQALLPSMKEVLFILFAYLIGSIPTAVWISRYFFGVDIRDYGSGNAGATNTFRVLGLQMGLHSDVR